MVLIFKIPAAARLGKGKSHDSNQGKIEISLNQNRDHG